MTDRMLASANGMIERGGAGVRARTCDKRDIAGVIMMHDEHEVKMRVRDHRYCASSD